MRETMDLFEMLKNLCGCECISDLKVEPYLTKARNIMQTICVELFPLFQLSDMAEYLFEQKVNFAQYQEAADFFQSQGKET